MTAAREGDLRSAQELLKLKPSAAKFCTFGVRTSPIHFAAARGHTEIVDLLLEHGTDVNCRNYCGQTAMMHACRFGRWEAVQSLIIYKADIEKYDLLSGRMAIHYAAASGHVQCLRLLLADYLPSSFEEPFPSRELIEIVNAQADSGVTALHFAALNGHTECLILLLDLGARVGALTGQEGIQEWDDIGSASTPLHYAACSGSLACCQILLSRGADRNFKNDNGWTSQYVARFWKRHAVEELLSPDCVLELPIIPPSRYLSLPLKSILSVARLERNSRRKSDEEACGVCLERSTAVASAACGHQLCVPCALNLCSLGSLQSSSSTLRHGELPCPFCRQGIVKFIKKPEGSVLEKVHELPDSPEGEEGTKMESWTAPTSTPIENKESSSPSDKVQDTRVNKEEEQPDVLEDCRATSVISNS